MRKKPSMMQPTNFTDFNPLDVLAAAASLQRRTEETDDGENENHKTGSGASAEEEEDTQEGGEDEDGGAAKTVNSEVAPDALQQQQQQQQNAGQCDNDQTVPETPAPQHGGTEAGTAAHGESVVVDVTPGALRVSGASVTAKAKAPVVMSAACEAHRSVPITPPPVPRMVSGSLSTGRPQLTDHSYAFVSQLQSLRADEDEGYSSRSSLDDDSEETVSRLNHKNGQYLTGWGGRPVSSLIGHTAKAATSAANIQPQLESEQSSPDSSRKATKIVILSKDSKLQRIISGINGEGSQLSGSSSGSSLMLRTLLGQKAALKGNAQGQNKVIIAGGLSGRVINVLKSGSISLAPPEGGPQQDTATPNDGTSLQQSDQAVGDTNDAVCSSVSKTASSVDHVIESAVGSPSTVDSQAEEAFSEQHLSAEVSTEQSQCDSLNTRSSEENVVIPSMTDIQKHSRALSEVSSRHGSEVVTEDETSCDSSKDDITVDTTPVMSPCADFTSPLMSPVSERDVPMMSPTVGSPEIMCDIFKLPSCIKYLPADTSVLREGHCKVTVNCVINEEAVSVCTDPVSVTDDPSDGFVNDTGEQAGVSPENQNTTDSSLQEQQTGEVGIEGALITNCDPSSESTQLDITPHSETDQQHSENEALGTEATEAEYSQEQVSPEDSSTKLESIAPVDDDPECVTQPQGHLDAQIGEDVSDTQEPGEDLPVLGFTDIQKGGNPDPSGTARNQYIIEDDESPVAKFGTPRSSTDDDGLSSECSSPMALAIAPSAANQGGQQTLSQPDVAVEKTSPVKVPVSGTESIKVIMTTEASNKSVFTAVRRPLMSGMKALPGSLHMVPVVSSSKSGVMHVVPVSGARGVVTQIIPKSGSQFITRVPVLSGKTVVLPDNSKGRMNTILVPVSMASSNAAAPISLVQTSKVKLANLQQPAVKTEPVETVPLSSLQRPELSSPLIFHGRITPVSVTSDTSELLSSPESSLHGGFSGVIMGGRNTPDTPDTLRPPSRTSLENSKDKISIKISSNSVMESDDSMSSEAGFSASKKETIGIGMMGSLSWKHIEPSSGRGLTQIGTGGAGREYVRIQGGELRTGFQASDEDSMPALEKPVKKPGRVPKSHDSKGSHVYNRKKNKLSAVDSGMALPPPTVSDHYTPSVAQLHPLIDHDYCMFTEFNAQIQSSIIATTESKTKIEKKYAKKTKAVRTKAVRGLITEESFKSVSKAAVEKIINKGRRGRLKKRRTSKEKAASDEEISLDGTEELDEAPMTAVEEKPRKIVELKPSRTSERRAKLQALKDDKNYVKITGSYQDEFVYFATKNKRNRPRKSLEDQNSQLTKQPQVGGMTVFDWYKDLSKADKTSRFGTPTTSGPSSPVPGFITHSGETEVRPGTASVVGAHETLQPTPNTSTSASFNSNLNNAFRPAATPIHESEVADLVCDLADINGLGNTVNTGTPVNDMDLSSFIIGGQDIKSEQTVATAPGTDPSSPAGVIPPVSMAEMAEQVREMLNSMGADELENLELKFGDVDPSTVGLTDTSFDGLLGGFTQEEVAITSHTTTNNLCDLDEINDSDLLQSDLGLLGDVKPSLASTNSLKPSASAPSMLLPGQGERLPAPAHTSSFGFSKTLEFGGMRLDKTELFPDMAPPPPPPADVSTLAANTAPELTLVSMYWNDLPGLVLMGQQYVRLVDIHKQVLPAKDTGILKKRCQMMGLSIANCSELQRDFLVRYANAAKSKSTVIVSKDAAQTLIGFYVEPKSRPSKQSVEERGIQLAEQARAQAAAAAAAKAAAEGSTTSAEPVDLQSVSATSSPAPSPMPLGGRKVTVKASPGIRRKRRLTGGSLSDGSPVPAAAGDVKRSARLRHKNVSYSDMLLGNHYDNQERKDDMSPTTSLPPSVILENHQNLVANGLQEKEPNMSEGSQENKETERMLFPEDIEIKKLKIKMRLKCLNAKEKRRLRRLREKVRKREMKRKLRERRKLDRTKGRKKASVMAAALANIVKTKKKLQETHMFNKKYNQEHCYAAAPVSPADKKEPVRTMDSSTNISVTDKRIPTSVEEVQSSTQLTVVTPVVVKTEAVEDVEMTPVEAVENTPPPLLPVKEEKKEVVATLRKETTVKSHSPQRVQTKVEKGTREERAVVEKPKVEKVKAKDPRPVTKTVSAAAVHRVVHQPPVAVLHRDAVQRLSQRSRWQDGQLYVDRFTDRQAVCISCTTCAEFFSVKRFLKHMHHQNNRDELAHVTLSQTLELRAGDSATVEERTIWAHFEKLREKLMGPVSSVSNNSTPCRARPASIPPSPPIQVLTTKTTATASPVTSKGSAEVKGRSPMTVGGTSKTGKNSPAAVSRAVAKAVSAATVVVNNRTAALNSSGGQSARGPSKQVPSASAPPKVRDKSSASGPTLVTSSAPPTATVGKGTTARTVTSPGTSRRDRVMAVAAKTRTLLANASRALTKSAETSVATTPQLRRVSHPPTETVSPTLVRHSTRVRKQKQLHPIEKYVFSSGVSPPIEPPPAKRPRLSAGEREPVLSLLASAASRGVLTSPSGLSSSSTTTCGRKVRLRLSTGGTTAKYDLRAPSESGRQ